MFRFSIPSMLRGTGMLLLLTLYIEFSDANRGRDEWNKSDYTWLLVCAGILAFIAAYGIGANDVANAYATSVGSKALTIKQAVVLAAIFEFLGAVTLGSQVAKTIRKGIADVNCFTDNPGLLMYGMTCVILSVAIWLLVASYLEMPVSTTHSAVGAIVGMTMMARGVRCVVWNYTKNDYGNGTTNMAFDNFPWLDGVAEIVASWFLSPIASGVCAAILYAITRFIIMGYDNSFLRAKIAFPFIVAFTIGVNMVFIIVKGTKGNPERYGTKGLVREAKKGNLGPAIAFAGWFAIGAFVLAALAVIPMSRWVEADVARKEEEAAARDAAKATAAEEGAPAEEESAMAKHPGAAARADAEREHHGAFGGVHTGLAAAGAYVAENINNEDPHAYIKTDETVSAIHENAREFDAKAEGFFRYVQVFTAIVDSYSHGANDVSNAMGPFSAVYLAWKKGAVVSKAELSDGTNFWILAIGGAGIVVGLATYGYKIMNVLICAEINRCVASMAWRSTRRL